VAINNLLFSGLTRLERDQESRGQPTFRLAAWQNRPAARNWALSN
jgi:hypothetical protein